MRIKDDDCCLDASAAVEVLLKRKWSALFTDFIVVADLVIGPTVLATEATNVFWKYQKFSEVPYAGISLTCCCHSARRACPELQNPHFKNQRKIFTLGQKVPGRAY